MKTAVATATVMIRTMRLRLNHTDRRRSRITMLDGRLTVPFMACIPAYLGRFARKIPDIRRCTVIRVAVSYFNRPYRGAWDKAAENVHVRIAAGFIGEFGSPRLQSLWHETTTDLVRPIKRRCQRGRIARRDQDPIFAACKNLSGAMPAISRDHARAAAHCLGKR